MNKQEYFDSVVKHLMAQTSAATDHEGVCVYHNEFGSRCAIGQALPAELAKRLSEQAFVSERGGGWQDVLNAACDEEDAPNEAAAEAVECLKDVPYSLLVATQDVHDKDRWAKRTIDDKIEMLIQLKEIARTYGLVWWEGAL